MARLVGLCGLALGLTGCLCFGCWRLAQYDGAYEGWVVEAQTNTPLADVVVLAVWVREYPTVAGGMEYFHAAREVVTDADGHFVIPGQGLRLVSNMLPASVLFFKAGYTSLGPYIWDAFERTGDFYNGGTSRREGKRLIIGLKKLTLEERRDRMGPRWPSDVPREQRQRLMQEINKDRIERGLGP